MIEYGGHGEDGFGCDVLVCTYVHARGEWRCVRILKVVSEIGNEAPQEGVNEISEDELEGWRFAELQKKLGQVGWFLDILNAVL